MKKLLWAFLLLFLTATVWAEVIPGRLIVQYKPGVMSAAQGVRAASVRSLDVKYQVVRAKQLYSEALKVRPDWTYLADYYVLYFPTAESVAAAVKDYAADPNVVMVAPSTRVHADATTPNDPHFTDQYGLTNIKTPQAWDRTTGVSSLVVAVLDTGIDSTHPDFLASRIDTARWKNIINPSLTPEDDFGHGTEVSGVIGAATNNATGIAGVDWQAKILPIKVLDNTGSGAIEDIVDGLAYASACDSDVINMSFGQYDVSALLEQACLSAYNNGAVLIASAGNGDVSWESFPAAYTTVLAVGAVDQADARSIWSGIDPTTLRRQASNFGPWVDVMAPGTSIWTTTFDGSYSGATNGTSLAAPFVSGLASLIKAVNPSLTNALIMNKITDAADNVDALNPGYAGWLGGGRINAYRSVSGIVASITTPESGQYVKGQVDFIGSASAWDFTQYFLEAYSGSTLVATIETGTASVENGLLGRWQSTQVADGSYTIKLRVLASGNSEEASVTLVVDNTGPVANISQPANGASPEGTVAILGSATDTNFNYYQLQYGAGTSPSVWETFGGNIEGKTYQAVNNSQLGTWETSGLTGVYTLRLTATDLAGNQTVADTLVDLINTLAPTKEVTPQSGGLPLSFTLPNPFNRTTAGTLTFNYNLAGNFAAKIYVFDMSGNLIWQKSYSAGENGGKAGANDPSWNATDNFGHEILNGIYLYQIVADNRVMARGKMIVLN